MNRTYILLLTIAVSALVSTASLSAADHLARKSGAREIITREIPWEGGNSLTIAAPAEVQYVQSDTARGTVVITGAARSVNTFSAQGGVLKDELLHTGSGLKIVVTAPKITRFNSKGGDKLEIVNYDQDDLEILATGRAEIRVSGRTRRLDLKMEGRGWADLSQLQANEAKVDLSGYRHAIINASDAAHVAGTGNVILLTRPPSLVSEIQGAGRLFVTAPTAPRATSF